MQEARETLGIEIRLTPDITRGVDQELARETAELAVRYSDRGVVALGLGGLEAQYPPEQYADAFAIARDGGLASVPHAGEVAGPASIRGALDALHADRIRHGVRAVEDPGLLRELADRQIVLDVCVLSNVCLSVVPSVAAHQLPQLLAAGVPCTVNTDDPTFFSCDLEAEHAAARSLGADPRTLFEAGIAGALCERGDEGRRCARSPTRTTGTPRPPRPVAAAAIVPAANAGNPDQHCRACRPHADGAAHAAAEPDAATSSCSASSRRSTRAAASRTASASR